MGSHEYRYSEMLDPYGRPFRQNARNNFWVDPDGERREKHSHPYSYSEFYLWGGPEGRKAAKDAVYSDRLAQWDREKFERCCRSVAPRKRWDQMSALDVSAWMTMYLGRPIAATALAEGCNVSNGYPYRIIWFRDAEPETKSGPAETPEVPSASRGGEGE